MKKNEAVKAKAAKLAKLAEVTTNNGATKAEAETAKKLAAKLAVPAKVETKQEVFLADVRITRQRAGSVNAHFFGSALKHLLSHAGNHPFSYRTIPYSPGLFGTGDFYNIVNWLLSENLVTKLINSQYRITDVKAVKERYNFLLSNLQLK